MHAVEGYSGNLGAVTVGNLPQQETPSPKEATRVLQYGSPLTKDPMPAYGYCWDHWFAVTKPRDPRIHRTAEPLIRVDAEPTSEVEQ